MQLFQKQTIIFLLAVLLGCRSCQCFIARIGARGGRRNPSRRIGGIVRHFGLGLHQRRVQRSVGEQRLVAFSIASGIPNAIVVVVVADLSRALHGTRFQDQRFQIGNGRYQHVRVVLVVLFVGRLLGRGIVRGRPTRPPRLRRLSLLDRDRRRNLRGHPLRLPELSFQLLDLVPVAPQQGLLVRHFRDPRVLLNLLRAHGELERIVALLQIGQRGTDIAYDAHLRIPSQRGLEQPRQLGIPVGNVLLRCRNDRRPRRRPLGFPRPHVGQFVHHVSQGQERFIDVLSLLLTRARGSRRLDGFGSRQIHQRQRGYPHRTLGAEAAPSRRGAVGIRVDGGIGRWHERRHASSAATAPGSATLQHQTKHRVTPRTGLVHAGTAHLSLGIPVVQQGEDVLGTRDDLLAQSPDHHALRPRFEYAHRRGRGQVVMLQRRFEFGSGRGRGGQGQEVVDLLVVYFEVGYSHEVLAGRHARGGGLGTYAMEHVLDGEADHSRFGGGTGHCVGFTRVGLTIREHAPVKALHHAPHHPLDALLVQPLRRLHRRVHPIERVIRQSFRIVMRRVFRRVGRLADARRIGRMGGPRWMLL
mmetsp:Transcript_11685/g.25061  ORF Transcript_11685/g.25061 Transcript_11685/m.25061 type:complete len:584 (-) Transcript_11685:328-2079(-)